MTYIGTSGGNISVSPGAAGRTASPAATVNLAGGVYRSLAPIDLATLFLPLARR